MGGRITIEHLSRWEKDITDELLALDNQSAKRSLVLTENADQTWLTIEGQRMLNLASNNYLGLAGDERLKHAMIEAIQHYGVGSTSSRLIVGSHPLYDKAEKELIKWKHAEAGIIVNSGYVANVGVISALIGRDDVVFSDKLNHASIVDGIVLSRAKHRRYRHKDLNHLEALLQREPIEKRKLIVTDTVFSMDGDIADLKGLVELKERYNALLMVDEAHASGVYGENGTGYAEMEHLQSKVDIQMGTFSKALGSYGAYVVGDKWLIDYLINRMRSLIYTTALPPAVLGSIIKSIEIVQQAGKERQSLHDLAYYFRSKLLRNGFNICSSETQIVPILVGENDRSIQFAKLLQQEGIAAIPVRPPTVPEKESRVRFTITSAQAREDINWALDRIIYVGKSLEVI
ncbi:8-amino-7-oxononanoate synthase [Cytobacillus sp. Hm23]